MSDLPASLFNPRSIAVIGASNDPGKWGGQYARKLLKGAHRRRVHLVNPRGGEILGQPAIQHCIDAPERLDAAVICVPVPHVESAITDALAAGALALTCITAGFAETGGEGRAMQDRIVAQVRQAGARLVGPNCLGLYDCDAEFECTSFWDVQPGAVGLASQSGTVLLDLGTRLGQMELGFARAVSMGNQADVLASEYLNSFVTSRSSRAVVAYLEDMKDVRAVFAAFERLIAAGKPCVLLTPGANAATSRAVASHTGSMLSNDAVIDETCRDVGVVRVRSIGAAARAVKSLLAPSRPAGRRIAVIADGGGGAVLGADACVAAGLEVPAFSDGLTADIAAALDPGSGCGNPVDAVGALCLTDMQPMVERVIASDEVDAILLTGALNNVDRVSADEDRATAAAISAAARAAGKGLVVASMWPGEVAVREIERIGYPLTQDATLGAEMLLAGIVMPPRRSVPPLPEAAEIVTSETCYFGARRLFASAGIPLMPAREVVTADEAVAAAACLGYPVVLKAMGTLHKSDAGGVILGIADEASLRTAFDDVSRRLSPPSFSLEKMATGGGVELIIGSVRQSGTGPVIVVGAGGTLAEILQDTVSALAPVTADYARDMLSRLKLAPLFAGYRGKPPVDLAAVAQIVADFSRILGDHPDLGEAEINPVLAGQHGAVALDARVVANG